MSGQIFRVVDDGVEGPGLTADRETAFHESPRLEVRLFNVGNGEIILLTMPDRRNVWLVDGGSGRKVGAPADAIIDYLADRVLRGVVLSHPHEDHGRAIEQVLRTAPLAETVTFYCSNDEYFDKQKGWLPSLRNQLQASAVQEEEPVTKNAPRQGVEFGDGVVADMFAGAVEKAASRPSFYSFGSAMLVCCLPATLRTADTSWNCSTNSALQPSMQTCSS